MHDISLRPWRLIWSALIAENTPKQIAWGIALGVLIGIIPKGNLIAIGLAAILFTLRVNLLAAMIAITIGSVAGLALDPFFDHMGRTILTMPPLQGPFAAMYDWQFVPWTAFNNTVVMGALFVGLLQLYPTYRIVTRILRNGDQAWDLIKPPASAVSAD